MPAPITFSDLLSRPRAAADLRIAYGQHPLQFGELWLPKDAGPRPVVAMIHGGCWRADLPGLELMDYACADLREHGVAVWNIEYRRIGHDGGGFPGTFLDVGAAIDHLRQLAGPHGLDLPRTVFSGHSAGGHLAVWALGRARLDPSSPLHVADPLPALGAAPLAGIIDLAAYHEHGPDECGGPGVIDALVGAGARETADAYADTSPPRLLPLGAPQTVISGALDHIVPSAFGAAYGRAAADAGDAVQVIDFADAGHFELIDPSSQAWPRIRAELVALLG
ncbi:MAG: alpha/beta hydrolase [Phenylobacterium sp.]|uniref:alpha/beta hydrolase n=1 Tax=Phenylobacterium sp. TaxID=1871053 RepID=UPI0025E565C6|nr:alpha/beta hydrolase [Phenylobacterium sp.]MBA4014339.1 alpha/beta hydrolase [Phenylobacterium sp.]